MRHGDQLYIESIGYSLYLIKFTYEERPDSVVNRNYGHDIVTALRCKMIEISIGQETSRTIRRYDLFYWETELEAFSLLKSLKLTAFRSADSGIEELTLPAVDLKYEEFAGDADIIDVDALNEGSQVPLGSSESSVLIDMTGSGLPGILDWQGHQVRYWRNRGRLLWDPPQEVTNAPAADDLRTTPNFLVDVEGKGVPDLVMLGPDSGGYFTNEARENFEGWKPYAARPTLDFADPEVRSRIRFIDLNNDRIPDLIYGGLTVSLTSSIEVRRDGAKPTLSSAFTIWICFRTSILQIRPFISPICRATVLPT